MTANVLLFKITLLVYFVATLFYLIGVISRRDGFRQKALWILLGGFGLHCMTIAVRWATSGAAPVASLHESLSFPHTIPVSGRRLPAESPRNRPGP